MWVWILGTVQKHVLSYKHFRVVVEVEGLSSIPHAQRHLRLWTQTKTAQHCLNSLHILEIEEMGVGGQRDSGPARIFYTAALSFPGSRGHSRCQEGSRYFVRHRIPVRTTSSVSRPSKISRLSRRQPISTLRSISSRSIRLCRRPETVTDLCSFKRLPCSWSTHERKGSSLLSFCHSKSLAPLNPADIKGRLHEPPYPNAKRDSLFLLVFEAMGIKT